MATQEVSRVPRSPTVGFVAAFSFFIAFEFHYAILPLNMAIIKLSFDNLLSFENDPSVWLFSLRLGSSKSSNPKGCQNS